MKKVKSGFTLVEILIVTAILIMVTIMMMMTLDPLSLVNRARDANRKKDINRIKVAFEEYFNDKGCYPNNQLVTQLENQTNCRSDIFSPWLLVWPCDPNGVPYQIAISDESNSSSACPKWFKILAKLEYEEDDDIPSDWQSRGTVSLGGGATSKTANFGVSSTNVSWYEVILPAHCTGYGLCYYRDSSDSDRQPTCQSAGIGCAGTNCFVGQCSEDCRVSCCGSGCN